MATPLERFDPDQDTDWCVGAVVLKIELDGSMLLSKNGEVKRVKVIGTLEMQEEINKLREELNKCQQVKQ